MDRRVCKQNRSPWHKTATIPTTGGNVSKLHGDKARFHRIRKQNILRRRKIRELQQKLAMARSHAGETNRA